MGVRAYVDFALQIMLYWHHYHESGVRIETRTEPTDTIAANFVKLLHRDSAVKKVLFFVL